MVLSYWNTINKYVFSYIFYAISSNYAVLITLLITVFLYIGDEFYIELKLRLFIFLLIYFLYPFTYYFFSTVLYYKWKIENVSQFMKRKYSNTFEQKPIKSKHTEKRFKFKNIKDISLEFTKTFRKNKEYIKSVKIIR